MQNVKVLSVTIKKVISKPKVLQTDRQIDDVISGALLRWLRNNILGVIFLWGSFFYIPHVE